MGMGINEAWGQYHAGCIDVGGAACFMKVANTGNAVAPNAHITIETGSPRAIHNGCVADQYVVMLAHGSSLDALIAEAAVY